MDSTHFQLVETAERYAKGQYPTAGPLTHALMLLPTAARLIALLLCVLWLHRAGAAEEPAPADAPQPIDSAPVIVDGFELFLVAGAPSLPAPQRADSVRSRIIGLARDRRISANDVVVTPRDSRIDVVARARLIVSVVETDAALEGAPMDAVAQIRAGRIREAIAPFRAEREPEQLTRAALTTLVATVIAVLALFLIARAFQRALRLFVPRLRGRAEHHR